MDAEEKKTKKAQKAEKKNKKKHKQKKKKSGSFTTILLVVIMIIGLGILLYPTISDYWNSFHASQVVAAYVEAVDDMSKEEKEAAMEAARAYNEKIASNWNLNVDEADLEEYNSLLNIGGNGVMGYIQIPKIGVNLPIYHTVEDVILQIAAGHIPGSSLPIGGENTHSLLSGHRGLPSAKLFTDLDQLEEGDIFTITVLDQTITYAVDQIRIVLPEETSDLRIEEGEDYCTLITCTPYGVNSHRMLVRGTRIENLSDIAVQPDALKIPTYIVVPVLAIPLLFIILILLLAYYKTRPGKVTLEDIEEYRKGL